MQLLELYYLKAISDPAAIAALLEDEDIVRFEEHKYGGVVLKVSHLFRRDLTPSPRLTSTQTLRMIQLCNILREKASAVFINVTTTST